MSFLRNAWYMHGHAAHAAHRSAEQEALEAPDT